jgi:hypothetical protein
MKNPLKWLKKNVVEPVVGVVVDIFSVTPAGLVANGAVKLTGGDGFGLLEKQPRAAYRGVTDAVMVSYFNAMNLENTSQYFNVSGYGDWYFYPCDKLYAGVFPCGARDVFHYNSLFQVLVTDIQNLSKQGVSGVGKYGSGVSRQLITDLTSLWQAYIRAGSYISLAEISSVITVNGHAGVSEVVKESNRIVVENPHVVVHRSETLEIDEATGQEIRTPAVDEDCFVSDVQWDAVNRIFIYEPGSGNNAFGTHFYPDDANTTDSEAAKAKADAEYEEDNTMLYLGCGALILMIVLLSKK